MTNQNDPISQIKEAEKQAKTTLEKTSEDYSKKAMQYENELFEKTKKFEEELREKGNQKLETVKKEASELFKSKMATAEKDRAQIIKSAKERHEEAVKKCTETFMDYLKKTA